MLEELIEMLAHPEQYEFTWHDGGTLRAADEEVGDASERMCYSSFDGGAFRDCRRPQMPQILRDPSVSHDTAMALILVATPMGIILVALGMIIFGGLILP